MDQFSQIPELLKLATTIIYVLAGIAFIGLFFLLLGVFKQKQELIERGGYTFGFGLIIAGCIFFVRETATDRMYNTLDNTYINIGIRSNNSSNSYSTNAYESNDYSNNNYSTTGSNIDADGLPIDPNTNGALNANNMNDSTNVSNQ